MYGTIGDRRVYGETYDFQKEAQRQSQRDADNRRRVIESLSLAELKTALLARKKELERLAESSKNSLSAANAELAEINQLLK